MAHVTTEQPVHLHDPKSLVKLRAPSGGTFAEGHMGAWQVLTRLQDAQGSTAALHSFHLPGRSLLAQLAASSKAGGTGSTRPQRSPEQPCSKASRVAGEALALAQSTHCAIACPQQRTKTK